VSRLLTIFCIMIAFAATVEAASPADFVSRDGTVLTSGSMQGEASQGLLDCGGAIEATIGTTYYGDTTGMTNNVSVYNCGPWDESGPEVVYHLHMAAPTIWVVTLTPTGGAELDLVVLNQCDEYLGCEIVVDSSVATNVPLSGDYYFVVEGRNGAAGAYEISFSRPETPQTACDGFDQVLPGEDGAHVDPGVYPLAGTTCNVTNRIGALACAPSAANGRDRFYEMYLLPGAQISATITSSADAALWLVDVCDSFENANCIAFADQTLLGQPETLTYLNDTGAPVNLWLVVDSWGTDTCGEFTGTIELSGNGAVNVEKSSWGALKSAYR